MYGKAHGWFKQYKARVEKKKRFKNQVKDLKNRSPSVGNLHILAQAISMQGWA